MLQLDEATREKGLGWFLWHWGILRFGLPFSILMSVFLYMRNYGFDVGALTSPEFWIIHLVAVVVMAPISGLIWGGLMWWGTTSE
jgi:hypothetical protein